MGRRHHTRPSTGAGRAAGVCTAGALVLAAALVAVPAFAPASVPGAPAAAPPASDTITRVRGTVVRQDDGRPVRQAHLRFRALQADSAGSEATAVSGERGRFRLPLATGRYVVVTRHLGFDTRRDTLRVPSDRSVRIRIPLAAAPVEVRPIEVNVQVDWLAREGFYDRRSKGFGKFITPEELDRRAAWSLTEALKTVPGVKEVQSCRGSFCHESLVMTSSMTQTGCDVTYYMDGNVLHGSVQPDNISVESVAAIEIYRGISETPAQFYGRCGSVVIWSKRGGS